LKTGHLSAFCPTMALLVITSSVAWLANITFATVLPNQDQRAAHRMSCAEIVVGPVTIRLEEGASAARIAAIARVLPASTSYFHQTVRIMVATKSVD
jgi:transposase